MGLEVYLAKDEVRLASHDGRLNVHGCARAQTDYDPTEMSLLGSADGRQWSALTCWRNHVSLVLEPSANRPSSLGILPLSGPSGAQVLDLAAYRHSVVTCVDGVIVERREVTSPLVTAAADGLMVHAKRGGVALGATVLARRTREGRTLTMKVT